MPRGSNVGRLSGVKHAGTGERNDRYWPAESAATGRIIKVTAISYATVGRRRRILACLGLGLLTALGSTMVLRRTDAVQAVGPCLLQPDKSASPGLLRLGQEVTVTLKVSGTCPSERRLADVVLVIDRSSSMLDRTSGGRSKLEAAREAALAFLDAVDPDLVHVGLVLFDAQASCPADLRAGQDAVREAVLAMDVSRGTNLVDSLDLGLRTVLGSGARADAQPVLVFMTDGVHGGGNGIPPIGAIDPVIDATRAAGITVDTIGLGDAGDIDEQLLLRIAGDPRHYHHSPDGDELRRIFVGLAGRVEAKVLLRQARIVDHLPADMRYVLESASPPAIWDPVAASLTWDLDSVGPEGQSLRFRVRPKRAGRHPTNTRADAEFVDGFGNDGRLVFPVPEVTVLAPLFLPLLPRQDCPKTAIDVALVVDTSSSMEEAATDGGTKLQAAVAAARTFVAAMNLDRDQVAIVTFDRQARLLVPLTRDRGTLEGALEDLLVGQGTRIDLGLDMGLSALGGPQARRRVIVLLTDGRPSTGFDSAALSSGRRAGDAGIDLYTVGLGADADLMLLELLSGSSDKSHFAPGAAELTAIYRHLAADLACE